MKYCLCLLIAFLSVTAFAQMSGLESSLIYSTDDDAAVPTDNALFIIHDISISGNRKTKPQIILRELPFHVNDRSSINVIADQLKQTKKQLMNTGLFSNVVLSLKTFESNEVTIDIVVTENWYLYPMPYFRTVDKNVQQWVSETNQTMNKVSYGIRLNDKNFTGRNDKLNVDFITGYTRQISVRYYGLFLDRDLKWSANAGFDYGKNKEVNYITLNNRQIPFSDNNQFLLSYFRTFYELTYRPAIKFYHTFSASYTYESIADTIFKLNPYFSPKPNIVRLPEFSYRLNYYDVDFIPYPTKGYIAEASIKKQGFNDPINLWQLTAKGSATWPMKKEFFFNLCAVGMLKLPFKQPYITKQFLGAGGQYLQGYEDYVIDGVAGGYMKATLARPVYKNAFSIHSQKVKKLNYIPLAVYAKTFVNTGYVYNRHPGQNELTNKFLYSGGVGLDIVIFTNYVIKLEWSFNRLGENGLYLHQRNNF